MRKRRATIGIALAAFAGGAGIASLFWYFHTNAEIAAVAAGVNPLRQGGSDYQFINPLLGYNLPQDIKDFDEYRPLQNAVQQVISAAPAQSVDLVGVYFRDLTLGRWMGINEDSGFEPGSMMKVVIMIAYFKEAEDSPGILSQQYVYSSAEADQLNGIQFEAPSGLLVGKTYTVEELIEAMIESSDNGAKNVLLDHIDTDSLAEIYTDLGLPPVNLASNYENYSISAKQYAVLLRVLYNATYLERNFF